MTDNIPVYRIRDKITPAFSVRDARPDIGRGNRKQRVFKLNVGMGKGFRRAAGPPGNHDIEACKQSGNVVPAVETADKVFPDREREPAVEHIAIFFRQMARRVDGVRDPAADELAVVDKEPVMTAACIRPERRIRFDGGKIEHFKPIRGRRAGSKLFVGRNIRRNENDPVKAEIRAQGVGKRKMTDMNRIERTAEKGDFHFFLPRFLRLRLTVAPKPSSSSL